MKLNAYLNFDGETEKAFEFYRSVFGGEFTALQRFRDVPASVQSPKSKAEADRIMHVALPVADGALLGSDISREMGMKINKGNNVILSLHPDSLKEAERLAGALSKGGKVEMKLQKMFWGDYYGALTDKFGIRWMVNYHEGK